MAPSATGAVPLDDRSAARVSASVPQAPLRSRTEAFGGAADSTFDSTFEPVDPAPPGLVARWAGWRRRLLAIGIALGFVAFFLLMRSIATWPTLHAGWSVDAQGRLELAASTDPALEEHLGEVVLALGSRDGSIALTGPMTPQRSPRWIVDDASRAREQDTHERITAALAEPTVTLTFSTGSAVTVKPAPRGVLDLPMIFWLLSLFGFALYAVALAVLLARATGRNVLYAVMALCQAANLMYIAVEVTFDLGLPGELARWNMPLRSTFDLITTAAMVNAACLHPRRLPGSGWIALLGWAAALALVVPLLLGWLPEVWWFTQIAVVVMGLVTFGLLSWSYRIEPHPFALVLRRFVVVTLCTWALLTAALAAAESMPRVPHNIGDIGATVWYVFVGSLLLLIPFLAKSQNSLREFTLLAAVSTIATSLALLFVAVFSLSPFAALTLSLFTSLGVYSTVRHWILNRMLSSSVLSTERMFGQLYRISRDIEAQPERTHALLAQLLGDLFEPLEVNVVDRRIAGSLVANDGSSMSVPVPELGGEGALPGSVMLRFAQRGRRLFTLEDARLTDRIVEQLRRAAHFDKAVEQGRSEERLRLAQDLHDDIGARLLTMMYKAESPEMEDYLRHTLQDLKTLTRGLAASNHRLSHASAEWKSDLSHRLTAAHVALKWSFEFDDDLLLTVVHWSALTRILRELVSNTIAHSQAQELSIVFKLERDRIDLVLCDDGIGRGPQNWSHGLGLGGVRKRVKQLGGDVEWRELQPRGICCQVTIRDLSARW